MVPKCTGQVCGCVCRGTCYAGSSAGVKGIAGSVPSVLLRQV